MSKPVHTSDLYWIKLSGWTPAGAAPAGYLNYELNRARITDENRLQSYAEIISDQNAEIRGSNEYTFKKILFTCICYSRKDINILTAATNAITILNAAEINMSNMDFQQIKVPGSILRNGVFVGTDLRGADLSKSNLSRTMLSRANFSNTNMLGVNFGQFPELHVSGFPKWIGTDSETNCIFLWKDNKIEIWHRDDKDGRWKQHPSPAQHFIQKTDCCRLHHG